MEIPSLVDRRADTGERVVERMVAAVEPSWSVERVEPSEEGSDQVLFLTVGTPGGPREVVLKAFAGDVVSASVAPSEPRVLELVADRTEVPVPEVVGYVDEHPGLPSPFFLAERLPGVNGSGRFETLSTAALERVLADAGENLAALHELRSFDRFGPVGVDGGELAVVDEETGRADRWADWLLADAEDTLDGMEGGPFDDLVPAVRDRLRETVPALDGPDEGAFVHWDYRLGNLLLDPETGETRAVLDWAGLVAGDPAYNLVTVEDHNVGWQTRDDGLRERLRGRFRSAYAERREGGLPPGIEERQRTYRLCHRLNAMACLPDWYADADEAVRAERAAEHRSFVRDYLD